jgi:hypothetical protein
MAIWVSRTSHVNPLRPAFKPALRLTSVELLHAVDGPHNSRKPRRAGREDGFWRRHTAARMISQTRRIGAEIPNRESSSINVRFPAIAQFFA